MHPEPLTTHSLVMCKSRKRCSLAIGRVTNSIGRNTVTIETDYGPTNSAFKKEIHKSRKPAVDTSGLTSTTLRSNTRKVHSCILLIHRPMHIWRPLMEHRRSTSSLRLVRSREFITRSIFPETRWFRRTISCRCWYLGNYLRYQVRVWPDKK